MSNLNRDEVQKQCVQFLESIGKPGFVVIGWQQTDGTYEVVQSAKDINPVAYIKGMHWATGEVMKTL